VRTVPHPGSLISPGRTEQAAHPAINRMQNVVATSLPVRFLHPQTDSHHEPDCTRDTAARHWQRKQRTSAHATWVTLTEASRTSGLRGMSVSKRM
jgi:hypothetical protein